MRPLERQQNRFGRSLCCGTKDGGIAVSHQISVDPRWHRAHNFCTAKVIPPECLRQDDGDKFG